MEITDYSYIGVGPIFMRDRNGSGGLVPVGEVSSANFSVEEEVKELPDHTAAGGGTRNEVRRVKSVNVKLMLHDLSPANLSMVLYGNTTTLEAGSVTAETVTVALGTLVPLANIAASSVVVTDVTDVTTYTAGTDYEVRGAGLWIPATSTIPPGSVHVAYSHPGQDVIEAFTQAASEYEMLLDGLNEARSGKANVLRAHRIRFGAAASVDWIGDDFAGLEIAGKLLADTTQGAGKSRFYKATIVQ
ncbi:hypothetical protein [Sedimenticola hydrogenitrophicus]|uniref:phage tail tube protein n=1 Tax=Sedimenticola hydrogenitrophicus TaxID=2967975 RepID=UPI0023AEED35|nr:hypothetical protein [Sedimenticola hydrogenitrophicus]